MNTTYTKLITILIVLQVIYKYIKRTDLMYIRHIVHNYSQGLLQLLQYT
jgi:hypothetical protein